MLRSVLEANRNRPWYRLRLTPELEQRFRAENDRRSASFVRSWLLVFIIFNVLSLKLDFEAFGAKAFVVPAVLTLGIFTPVAAVAILALRGLPSARRVTAATIAVSLTDMVIVLNGARTVPEVHADVYLVLAVIVPLVVGLIAPLSFRHSLVFCGLAFTLYLGWVLILPRGELAGDGAGTGGLEILVACLILVPIKISFSREKQDKQAFLLRLILEAQASKLADANARLQVLSETDALTGLANRRAFDAALASAWDTADAWCAVVAIDIDQFKRLNDTAGHPEGDRCLVAVAAALGARTREAGGLLARYGGEEFMALFPAREPDAALALGESLRATVEALAYGYGTAGAAWTVTVSVGVTAAHGTTVSCGVEPSDLIKAADAALYRAKSLGRNRVEAETTVPRPANHDGAAGSVYSAASS
jgi:diguanylate cyclase (GGDEF)-like protein